MRKWFFIFLVFIANIQLSFAQNNLIEIKSSGTNLFIEHKVSAKESLYSLGRLYNVAPKELAAYNKLTVSAGLSIGQDLKIPLTQNNFSQTDKVGADEVLVPVYHNLQAHETLFRLNQQFKVTVDQLKKWNNLQSDAISTGTSLIVGFLKVDKNQSLLAGQKYIPAKGAPTQKEQEEKPKMVEVEVITANQMEKVIKKQQPVLPVAKVTEEKIEVTIPVNQSRIDFAGGTFKKFYEKQDHQDIELNSETAIGSTFKSTSGWQDGRYYCFNNEATAGTILKIMNKETGKSVYAKVLDVIPDIKQNTGLQIIISNAAAEELGVGEKFECSISL